MKLKHITIVAGFMVVGMSAHAQEQAANTAAQVQAQQAIEVVQNQVAQEAQQEVQVVETAPTVQLIQQPVTVVEASPLTTSRADQMRKAREEAEVSTEQKIVEKLEESRLEDEKRRAEALFGGGLNSLNKEEAKEAAQPQVIMVQPVPAPAVEAQKVEEKAPNMDEVREAVRAELKANVKEEDKKEEKKNQMFISTQVGTMSYGLDYVDTKKSLGVSVGTLFPTNWSVEFGYIYSNHYIDESAWVYSELLQHNISLSTRYNLTLGRLRPNVGVMLSYTTREYSEPRDAFNGYSYDYIGTIESQALDYGILIGLDALVSNNFSVGLDYRYISNLSSEYSNDDQLNAPGYAANDGSGLLLEGRDYDMWSVSLKYLF